MQKKSNNNFSFIKVCRLCGSDKLKRVFKFNDVPIGNNLSKNLIYSTNAKRYPLEILRCDGCKHFQLSININPKVLYTKNYSYLTGTTKTFKKHFNEYSKWIIDKCNLKKSSLILDIGSNDGTCLNYFKKKKMEVVGIDPAKLPCNIANKNGIYTLNDFLNLKTAKLLEKKFGKFDFITSHNVLAHIENINEVFRSIYFLLKENSYFCFEVGYFKFVLKKNYFDTVYHEHLDYHHANPLIKFLTKIGFNIKHISNNKIQGGTIRILVKKEAKTKSLNKNLSINNYMLNEEKFFKLNQIRLQFSKFQESMNKLNSLVNNLVKKKEEVYAYGSPTKASLLLISANLNKGFIKYTFEDNSLKCNKFIPGTDIKIISSNQISVYKPKFIMILAWNFTEEIRKRLKKNRFSNISLIIPLPKPKLLKI